MRSRNFFYDDDARLDVQSALDLPSERDADDYDEYEEIARRGAVRLDVVVSDAARARAARVATQRDSGARRDAIASTTDRASEMALMGMQKENDSLRAELARAREMVSEELASERRKRRETEDALAELCHAFEASNDVARAYAEELDTLRRSNSGVEASWALIEPTEEARAVDSRAVEAHLIWRRREARNEPGDAASDWAKSESIVQDRLARADGKTVAYWAYVRSVAELLRLGDVAALDTASWRTIGELLGRVVDARDATK